MKEKEVGNEHGSHARAFETETKKEKGKKRGKERILEYCVRYRMRRRPTRGRGNRGTIWTATALSHLPQ